MIRKIGEKADNVGNDRTIYDVGWGTLIGRNIVAGMSRAFGGILLNILFLVILGSVFARYIWPHFQSSYEAILNASEMLTNASQTLLPSGENGALSLFGDKVRFDIKDLGNPGSKPKSIELSPGQLEDLLFQNEN